MIYTVTIRKPWSFRRCIICRGCVKLQSSADGNTHTPLSSTHTHTHTLRTSVRRRSSADLLFDWCQRLFLINLMHLWTCCVTPPPCCCRSSFSGTARSRRRAGANGLRCRSLSLWQTAGGRWGLAPLTPEPTLTSEWQTVSCSVCLRVCDPSSPYLRLLFLPWCLFFYVSLSLPPLHLTCPLIHGAVAFFFYKCHSSSIFFAPSMSVLPSALTHLSHSTWFTAKTLVPRSSSESLSEHTPHNTQHK